MDTYFPKNFVQQTDLEAFDGVSEGKYTIGLGQNAMAFCDEREDINSICMNAVSRLLEKNNISPKDVGRLEVGTETIVDKSKSVKSTLMDLFAESGNTNIEGIDTTNACYGGTNALFNALQWVESSYWDGRYAVVVAGDIAVYEKGPARPTGGAAAVAMLIGPDATLAFDQGIRGTHMENAYDFYKPVLPSEYPLVDGKLSNDCYLRAVDQCFSNYSNAFERVTSSPFSLNEFDYAIFHSPYSKLVQKSWARLYYLDYLKNPSHYEGSGLAEHADKPPTETYNDRDLQKIAVAETKDSYKEKVLPSLGLGLQLGNSYCGSLYAGLQSLVDSKRGDLLNKRVAMFSYGSGLAATLFSLRVNKDPTAIAEHADIQSRLAARTAATPQEFTDALQRREDTHNLAPFEPEAGDFPAGVWRLGSVDEHYRRHYVKE